METRILAYPLLIAVLLLICACFSFKISALNDPMWRTIFIKKADVKYASPQYIRWYYYTDGTVNYATFCRKGKLYKHSWNGKYVHYIETRNRTTTLLNNESCEVIE
jgi:hypothetical protein